MPDLVDLGRGVLGHPTYPYQSAGVSLHCPHLPRPFRFVPSATAPTYIPIPIDTTLHPPYFRTSIMLLLAIPLLALGASAGLIPRQNAQPQVVIYPANAPDSGVTLTGQRDLQTGTDRYTSIPYAAPRTCTFSPLGFLGTPSAVYTP